MRGRARGDRGGVREGRQGGTDGRMDVRWTEAKAGRRVGGGRVRECTSLIPAPLPCCGEWDVSTLWVVPTRCVVCTHRVVSRRSAAGFWLGLPVLVGACVTLLAFEHGLFYVDFALYCIGQPIVFYQDRVIT